MALNRLEALTNLLAQDPSNHFSRYALAMEYGSSGDLEQAVAEYKKVLEANSGYVAAYFHQGQALEKLGRLEDARAVYRVGLDACNRTADMHTRSEIQTALDILG